MKNLKLDAIRAAYERGENITELLREEGADSNSIEAIEIAYDLQSGTYINGLLKDKRNFEERAAEIGEILALHVSYLDTFLDCGAGELTTLSGISHYLPMNTKMLAFDLSISRLNTGLRFASRAMRYDLFGGLEAFSASMDHIPLNDNSIDVIFTNHSLEPNYGRELHILKELLRVSRKKLLLFEPSFEDNSEEGQSRMKKLGYVRNLPKWIREAGGVIVDKFPLRCVSNRLNPTYCYVVEKEDRGLSFKLSEICFRCPISHAELKDRGSYLWSRDGALAYPKINNISLLRSKDAILMFHE
ncbi:class I SAM-dependent methyltransferase [Vreelandella titanicae]|uniref:class I SAM-dependent methyltransferase n=1 Tax=Vreelandella titanicae TaxID=664683 RepID=UPI001F3F837D|nr:class I SAM-dependent methyltransferase [Halomonas titanicae]MCE7518396.1 class I SAM-dependent methyltransferase [Halomonas titanicae]|tara:strand:- start:11632 stop:12534 length:903 start_codon:yes stop_codon:yes gene_type:complete